MKSAFIIGSGNIATQLGKFFVSNNIRISGVYSRDIEHSVALADLLNAPAISELAAPPASDFTIIAIADSAIHQVSDQLANTDSLILHTSGLTPMSVLSKHKHHGVLYPLQTITQSAPVDFTKVPFLIEANAKTNEKSIQDLMLSLGCKATLMDSDQRQYLHLAAVFANNFTNHMYRIAFEILTQHNIPIDFIKPLVLEAANKVQLHSPADIQTGPAKRKDMAAISQHMQLLKSHSQYRQLYELISRSIIETT